MSCVTADVPRYRTFLADSDRWRAYRPRAGDVILSAPPKAGITHAQVLCTALLHGSADLPAPLSELSPWLDLLTRDVGDITASLDRQPGRRVIKTHTPLDGLPWHEDVVYLCLGRDPRDCVVSWHHHLRNLATPTLLRAVAAVSRDALLAGAATVEPPAATLPETIDRWLDDDRPPTAVLSTLRSTLHHHTAAWDRRGLDNVHLLRHEELVTCRATSLIELGALLGRTVDERAAADMDGRLSIEACRRDADRLAPDAADGLLRDNAAFFRSGAGDQWRECFSAEQVARYDVRAEQLADRAVLRWLHEG